MVTNMPLARIDNGAGICLPRSGATHKENAGVRLFSIILPGLLQGAFYTHRRRRLTSVLHWRRLIMDLSGHRQEIHRNNPLDQRLAIESFMLSAGGTKALRAHACCGVKVHTMHTLGEGCHVTLTTPKCLSVNAQMKALA